MSVFMPMKGKEQNFTGKGGVSPLLIAGHTWSCLGDLCSDVQGRDIIKLLPFPQSLNTLRQAGDVLMHISLSICLCG